MNNATMIRKMEIVFNKKLSSSATSHKPVKETASKLPSVEEGWERVMIAPSPQPSSTEGRGGRKGVRLYVC
jgi:hypothetical protein